MNDQPLTVRLALATFCLAVLLGIALPRYPTDLQSDARWYHSTATSILEVGLTEAARLPQPSVSGTTFAQRPPAHALLLATIFSVAGEGETARYLATLAVLSALAAASVIFVGSIAARVCPEPRARRVAVVLFAFAPTTVWLPRTQLSEALAGFLITAFVAKTLITAERNSPWALFVCAGLGATAILTRVDLLPAVLLLPMCVAVSTAGTNARRLAVAGIGPAAVLLCLPYSVWISAQTPGLDRILVATGPAPTGFSNLQTTLALAPEEYMSGFVDFELGRAPKALRSIRPEAWGADTADIDRIEALAVELENGDSRPTDGARAELTRIAETRAARSPMRHFLYLPAHRSFMLWSRYHQTQTENESLLNFGDMRTTIRSLWNLPYVLLVVAGGAAALLLTAAPRNAAFPIASLLVVRTVSLAGLGSFTGYIHVLPRYMAPFTGFTLVVLAALVVPLLRPALASREADSAG